MQYKKHFLTDVIIRIDFTAPIEQAKDSLTQEVRNVCIKYFPIVEERNVEKQEVVVNDNPNGKNTIINKERVKEWHFWSKTRSSEICITKNCIYMNSKTDYISFENFVKPFFDALKQMSISYLGIRMNRIGLRYVNQINLSSGNVIRKNWMSYWKKYINSSLVKALEFIDEDSSISRQMNSIEMNYGDYMLRFQYGIFNEDYPAPNKKNQFIIDTDVYATGLFNQEEIVDYVNKFHDQEKRWFEKAISENLRKEMEVIKADEAE